MYNFSLFLLLPISLFQGIYGFLKVHSHPSFKDDTSLQKIGAFTQQTHFRYLWFSLINHNLFKPRNNGIHHQRLKIKSINHHPKTIAPYVNIISGIENLATQEVRDKKYTKQFFHGIHNSGG